MIDDKRWPSIIIHHLSPIIHPFLIINSLKTMKNKAFLILITAISSLVLAFSTLELDDQLQRVIKTNQLDQRAETPKFDSAKVELGRMLFFDKLLSGNKDISCATCHHPSLGSGDELPLAIGVGGKGLGKQRLMGEGRERVPRNSPDIFNRGSSEWHTMFWDNRVSNNESGGFGYDTPAEGKLLNGLENLLAVQAMFPVTSRDEMRGDPGDTDVFGEINELALISDASPQAIWHRLMLRIMEFPKYRELFKDAYPEVKENDFGFQHAANAIAAFEIEEFTFNDSPWDNYIAGQRDALSEEAKRGALLFYDKANCSSCHSGTLMTDQKTHNLGVPQLGPGKGNAEPLDVGRYLDTGEKEDLFAFRTPPLKNVALTGPYMHNGAYQSLEAVIRHHLDPEKCIQEYDCDQLPEELRSTCKKDQALNERIIAHLDPNLKPKADLKDMEIRDLVAFLEALTDAGASTLDDLVPSEVPSGLPVVD